MSRCWHNTDNVLLVKSVDELWNEGIGEFDAKLGEIFSRSLQIVANDRQVLLQMIGDG